MIQDIRLDSLEEKEIIPGFWGKIIHSDKMSMIYWRILPGSTLPEHHHVHEQITQLLEGSFELTLDGKTQILEPGQVIVIPSEVPHSGRALSDCKILDIFCPSRQEYQ